ncbi:hypothetical protein HELRODRAFT_184637, partial [Helobdella robusta]|uniref:Uncharacterized protein n=1 Tax=Helobdella robusta TaxID=6412 RepID=T1FLM9_HELRO
FITPPKLIFDHITTNNDGSDDDNDFKSSPTATNTSLTSNLKSDNIDIKRKKIVEFANLPLPTTPPTLTNSPPNFVSLATPVGIVRTQSTSALRMLKKQQQGGIEGRTGPGSHWDFFDRFVSSDRSVCVGVRI